MKVKCSLHIEHYVLYDYKNQSNKIYMKTFEKNKLTTWM